MLVKIGTSRIIYGDISWVKRPNWVYFAASYLPSEGRG